VESFGYGNKSQAPLEKWSFFIFNPKKMFILNSRRRRFKRQKFRR